MLSFLYLPNDSFPSFFLDGTCFSEYSVHTMIPFGVDVRRRASNYLYIPHILIVDGPWVIEPIYRGRKIRLSTRQRRGEWN